MNRTSLVKAVVVALMLCFAPKVSPADDLASVNANPSLLASAKAEAVRFAANSQGARNPSSLAQTNHNKKGRKVAYGVLLGVAGFYGGAFLGAAVEPNCHCDDPGLKGALIGAPLGAIAGAVFGTWLGGR